MRGENLPLTSHYRDSRLHVPVPALSQPGDVLHEPVDAQPAADAVAGVHEGPVHRGGLLSPGDRVVGGQKPGPSHPHVAWSI